MALHRVQVLQWMLADLAGSVGKAETQELTVESIVPGGNPWRLLNK